MLITTQQTDNQLCRCVHYVGTNSLSLLPFIFLRESGKRSEKETKKCSQTISCSNNTTKWLIHCHLLWYKTKSFNWKKNKKNKNREFISHFLLLLFVLASLGTTPIIHVKWTFWNFIVWWNERKRKRKQNEMTHLHELNTQNRIYIIFFHIHKPIWRLSFFHFFSLPLFYEKKGFKIRSFI